MKSWICERGSSIRLQKSAQSCCLRGRKYLTQVEKFEKIMRSLSDLSFCDLDSPFPASHWSLSTQVASPDPSVQQVGLGTSGMLPEFLSWTPRRPWPRHAAVVHRASVHLTWNSVWGSWWWRLWSRRWLKWCNRCIHHKACLRFVRQLKHRVSLCRLQLKLTLVTWSNNFRQLSGIGSVLLRKSLSSLPKSTNFRFTGTLNTLKFDS